MAHIITALAGDVADQCKVKRALLSVSDKTGLIELVTFLASQGVELLSTGGTAAAIRGAGKRHTHICNLRDSLDSVSTSGGLTLLRLRSGVQRRVGVHGVS
jgi:hypothetical protein